MKKTLLLDNFGFTTNVRYMMAEWAAIKSKENIPEMAYIPMKRAGIITLTVDHEGEIGTPEATVIVTTTTSTSVFVTKRSFGDTHLLGLRVPAMSFIQNVLDEHILDYYVDETPTVQLKREFKEFFKNYMFEDKRGKYAKVISTVDGVSFLVFKNDISAPAKEIVHPYYHDKISHNNDKQYLYVHKDI